MRRDTSIVPALMFHSVGLEDHPWVWSGISEPVTSFAAKISAFEKKGFTGVFWSELYDYMAGGRPLSDNSILLTLDDGYLDNWVYVYPILKKYGMKGTIFVSPDFVDPEAELRFNLDDVEAGRCQVDQLAVAGFLSWAEMREMRKSGLIDIQSHAMTHTWYFSGPTVVDFHRHHDIAPYPWLFWNARPDRKPFYLIENQKDFLPVGYPILESEKSLIARRYFPDDGAVDEVLQFVESRGSAEFFFGSDWRTDMGIFLERKFGKSELPGRYESGEEREARLVGELRESKTLIEENLQKRVEYMSWPGGGNDEIVQHLAKDLGYKSWTLSSRCLPEKRNRPGADPISIKRMGTTNRITVRNKDCGMGGPGYQLWRILAHQGSRLYASAVYLRKLLALVVSLIRPRT